MAATEKRFPRATFTRKLIRICERLDACSTHTLSFKHWFLNRPESCTSTATKLWVVGSYARGALDCGDLDLVVEVHSTGPEPPQRKLMKALCGALPFVRCYAGTPAENSSGIEFPNPVEIWSGPGSHWRSAIDAITPDAAAGRAKRPIDALPFRVDQMDTHIERLEELLKLKRKGVLEWNFVEFDQDSLAPLASGEFKESEEYVARCLKLEFVSQKTLRLLPPLTRFMRKVEPDGKWHGGFPHRTQMWCGGTLLLLGRPTPSVSRFDDDPKLRQLGLVPHLSARGPNGVWLLRRGRNHADTLALSGVKAFYLAEEGSPCIVTWVDHSPGYERETDVLELFLTHADALRGIEEWNEGTEPDDQLSAEVTEVSGGGLLRLTGSCDVLRIGEIELAMTHTGSSFAGSKSLAKLADIVTALSASRSSVPGKRNFS
ncbi:hypothetical protein J2W32_001456 [Variovorax boronicumulans]|uniref:Polymerase nucleotidyl transferase domain-containing protein n=1 Tax=Variovorax boronicumulans TaxID=436515 RepID=A0AAW8CSH0_9BURK|nr:hypothetical protein [Variovorax boronicumulans]MDP9893242.1 hypothetical protein [Variovorax boronicumulans]MDQ0052414.1 hypothetical protein [Variovorax boronicumulans]